MAGIALRRGRGAVLVAPLLGVPTAAWAHVESGVAAYRGFLGGFMHPLTGLDHVVAMVAVGLLGAILGAPAVWVLPVVFPLVMTLGAVLGVVGLGLPAIEVGIAASALVLGGLVAANARPPLAVALLLVAVFAVYHGYPHGTAMPDYEVPLLYAAGFVTATGMLHLSGILLGLLLRWRAGRWLVRGTGGAIAGIGLYFLAGLAY